MELSDARQPSIKTVFMSHHVETPLIEFRAVGKSFGTQPTLRDVSLSVRPGETLVLIGESGCGKSVMMKLMVNLLAPSAGEVYWSGRPVSGMTDREVVRERLRFGYLFQGGALFDSLSVFENVAFGLRQNRQLSESDLREIVYTRLLEVGLQPATVIDKMPAELSGGMRKRVGLARALALDPQVMLYDEPTTGLDPIMSDVINELILKTAARNVTSVVVTHDMHTVRKVSDRVLMLHPCHRLRPGESQLIFEGSAAEAFVHPDARVRSFVLGEAGERLKELAMTA